jgi:hypothetical protein
VGAAERADPPWGEKNQGGGWAQFGVPPGAQFLELMLARREFNGPKKLWEAKTSGALRWKRDGRCRSSPTICSPSAFDVECLPS